MKINKIGQIPRSNQNTEKLLISHNKLASLDGIWAFPKLTLLSVNFNKIKEWKELLKIKKFDQLEKL